MADNVTAIYDSVAQQVRMLVVDASDLSDRSFNPLGCTQIPLDVATYNDITSNEELYAWIYSVVQSV